VPLKLDRKFDGVLEPNCLHAAIIDPFGVDASMLVDHLDALAFGVVVATAALRMSGTNLVALSRIVKIAGDGVSGSVAKFDLQDVVAWSLYGRGGANTPTS
jgi:hypothetical protein